jgi:hypothetical protein
MSFKKTISSLLIVIFLSGCVELTMQVKNVDPTRVTPMGLYVCAATQGTDAMDPKQRQLIIDLATEELTKLFKGKFRIIPLNDKIPHNEVFKKPPGMYYINEEKIIKTAKEEGCNSALILYYAAFNKWQAGAGMFGAIGGALTSLDNSPTRANDIELYSYFSLYGGLYSTDNSSAIAKSRKASIPLDDYIKDKNNKEQLSNDYRNYIQAFTREMFLPMVEDKATP